MVHNIHDLMVALRQDSTPIDVLAVVTDNASDYSQDSDKMQFYLGRIFRQWELVKLAHSCHAPKDSIKNVPIEGTWPALRRKLIGQELGKSVATSREALFAKYAAVCKVNGVVQHSQAISVTNK
jgi:hypothetical protein